MSRDFGFTILDLRFWICDFGFAIYDYFDSKNGWILPFSDQNNRKS